MSDKKDFGQKAARISPDGFMIYCSDTNRTTSLGVQSKMVHIFSKVSSVILLPFFKVSKVLLSIPAFKRLYWEISLRRMVSHKGV